MDNCLKQQEKEIDAFIKLNADFQLMYMREVFLGRRPNQDLHRLVGIYKQSVCSQEFTLENRHITKRIKQYFGDRPKESIRILDHGSGGWGATVFLLMALGYKKVSGLHIDNVDAANQFAREYFGAIENPLREYDGAHVPFEDNSFDFIFSEQVLEHVVPDIIEDYYSEEARVLSPGGICYHIAPHRIRPYDSHSKTWLIHYLPRRLWLWFLARLGRDASSHEISLFLRTRYFHFQD